MKRPLDDIIGYDRNCELREITGRCMCCMLDDVEGNAEVIGLMCHVIDRAAWAIVEVSDFEQLCMVLEAVKQRAEATLRGGEPLQ